tara:strand:- start:138 stop:482 length:345 start_codon:yes stop_codon:yes gene_type:complete
MKAILIDPVTNTVSEVESGDFRKIQKLLDCKTFTAVYGEGSDVLYVDDEGLLVHKNQAFRLTGFHPHPLMGRGLVVGTDFETGEDREPTMTVDEVRDNVTWFSSWGVYDYFTSS